MTGIRKITFLLLCCLFAAAGSGQSIAILGSPPAIQVQNASDVLNGKQVTHTSLSVTYPALNVLTPNVELYVRAEFANLSGTSGTIPSNKMGILVTNLTGVDPERFLTTTDQRLFHLGTGLLGSVLGGTQSITIRYNLLGGTHLLQPAGTYSVRVFYRVTLD